jgi:hypothetical protein
LNFPDTEISSFKIKDIKSKDIANIVPDNFISKKEYSISMPEIVSLINIEDNSFFNRESIINIK